MISIKHTPVILFLIPGVKMSRTFLNKRFEKFNVSPALFLNFSLICKFPLFYDMNILTGFDLQLCLEIEMLAIIKMDAEKFSFSV